MTFCEPNTVWKAVYEEAKSILVLPRLYNAQIESGFDIDGNIIDGSVAPVRSSAILSALHLLRSTFEERASELRASDSTDPFKYWRELDDEMLHTLRPLARALLCPPASSADSERAFSSAGFIDDPLRARLNDEGLSELVLIRDWALAEGTESVSHEFRKLL